jgi:Family of unknown function (DUF6544)
MLKNLIIGIGITLGLAASWIWISNDRFNRQTEARIADLLDHGRSDGRVVTEDDLSDLPQPVQNWLRTSGILGQPIPKSVRLRQEGKIRLGPDQPWMPFHADQYYTIDPPAFLWRVSASMAPGIFIRGVDSLRNGQGGLQMFPLALFKIVDASGPKIDQGTALRYLQETVWFPSAALSPVIQWTSIDEFSAQATLTLETLAVTGTFFFDESGHVVNFEAQRYRDEILDRWTTPMRDHKRMDGIMVPTEGEGVWGEADNAFIYIRIRLIDVERDIDKTYP